MPKFVESYDDAPMSEEEMKFHEELVETNAPDIEIDEPELPTLGLTDDFSFNSILAKWRGYLHYASVRYSDAHRSSEDVFQECSIVLFEFLSELRSERFDPRKNPKAFAKMFKTKLFHKLSDSIDFGKAQKRDLRTTVSGDAPIFDDSRSSIWEIMSSNTELPDSEILNADTDFEFNSKVSEMMSLLSPDGKKVLELFVKADEDDLFGQQAVLYEGYERVPRSKVTNLTIHRLTGIEYRKVRYVLEEIRRVANRVFVQKKIPAPIPVDSRVKSPAELYFERLAQTDSELDLGIA